MAHSETFLRLVASVSDAAEAAQGELLAHKLQIDRVDLEVAMAATKAAGAAVELGPVSLGGEVSKGETHTISVALARPRAKPKQGITSTLADDLAQAIVVAGATSRAAAEKLPALALESTAIQLRVACGKDGKAKLWLGGSASSERAHTVRITLRPA